MADPGLNASSIAVLSESSTIDSDSRKQNSQLRLDKRENDLGLESGNDVEITASVNEISDKQVKSQSTSNGIDIPFLQINHRPVKFGQFKGFG